MSLVNISKETICPIISYAYYTTNIQPSQFISTPQHYQCQVDYQPLLFFRAPTIREWRVHEKTNRICITNVKISLKTMYLKEIENGKRSLRIRQPKKNLKNTFVW